MDILASLAVGAVGGYALGWLNARETDDRSDVRRFLDARREDLEGAYVTGEGMDYVEYEDRVAVLERPGTEEIMQHATDVDGVGVETALEIARHFEGDYDAYRDATRAQLESVNGVGENRATAIRNR